MVYLHEVMGQKKKKPQMNKVGSTHNVMKRLGLPPNDIKRVGGYVTPSK